MKKCPTCDTNKPKTEYYTHKTRGLAHECKECNKARSRAYGAKNREARRAYTKKWREENATPEYNRNRSLRHRYGIDAKRYDQMLDEQGGVCAICGGTNPDGKRLSVDHDHSTGEVRKLLCLTCNWQVGFVENNPGHLEKLMKYLL